MMHSKRRVFISYKRKDKKTVLKIKNKLEKVVGDVFWMDITGIESDSQFLNVIIKAINDCEVLLFMYSKLHIEITDWENDWTLKELNFAKSKKKKKIVFLNIDNAPLSDIFSFEYGGKQQIDATNTEEIFKLGNELKNWLSIDYPDSIITKNNRFSVVFFSSLRKSINSLFDVIKGLLGLIREAFSEYKKYIYDHLAGYFSFLHPSYPKLIKNSIIWLLSLFFSTLFSAVFVFLSVLVIKGAGNYQPTIQYIAFIPLGVCFIWLLISMFDDDDRGGLFVFIGVFRGVICFLLTFAFLNYLKPINSIVLEQIFGNQYNGKNDIRVIDVKKLNLPQKKFANPFQVKDSGVINSNPAE